MAKTHISNIPHMATSVTRNTEGYVSYDPQGVGVIKSALIARNGRMDQRVLSGEEFGEYDQNTRVIAWHKAMQKLDG